MIKLFYYYFFPQRLFTTLIHFIAHLSYPKTCVHILIYSYSRIYRINTCGLQLSSYKTLNDFFIRQGKNIIDAQSDVIVSPADGQIVGYGKITENSILQVKGITYTLEELLVNEELARQFFNGSYVNIHLRPFDYHRFYMPLSASILGYGYIRGKLFPVNYGSRAYVQKLYQRNERLITILKTPYGKILVIKIAALGVGGIKVAYTNIDKESQNTPYHFLQSPQFLNKGDELGYFELGSSILMLFEKNQITFDSTIGENSIIQYGKKIGSLKQI